MAETGRGNGSLLEASWFLKIVQTISGEGVKPVLVGLGFHSLMKKSSTGGFVGQLGRDVLGAAVGGLPGLVMVQGTDASNFFGNAVIILYYEDHILLLDLGYEPMSGSTYEEVTLSRGNLRRLRMKEIEPTITKLPLKNLDLDYDKYEHFSLKISPKLPIEDSCPYEFPLKITFPLSKEIHNTKIPLFMRGTASAHQFIELFHGTIDLIDPRVFMAMLGALRSPVVSSKVEFPDNEKLVRLSRNEYFMKEFMHEFNRAFPVTRKRLLLKVFPTLPSELRESIRQHFIEFSEGNKEHSIGIRLLRGIGIGVTAIGVMWLPFNATADNIGLSGMMVMTGVLLLIAYSLAADKVNTRKWYAKHLPLLDTA